MIDLYTWPTPNGQKVHIMLEEVGLPYKVIPIDIGAGDQFKPDYLKINPNNKMPAIVDTDGPGGKPFAMMESAAILMYLAEKTGKFMPKDMSARYTVIQWLFFQMASVGPMFGQNHHFSNYAPEKLPYAINRYKNEAGRIYGVLNKRLAEVPYLAGEYSIADMATYPWARLHERQGVIIDELPNVKRWLAAIHDRPAVIKGMQILTDRRRDLNTDKQAREMLFGQTQYQKR